ncbi:RICIN domain-containing protein [Streptomyces sp. NBC_00425]|uniref:RICIN domain-containing protein n=1 Tax=Streptomyces sp. NBC_00425 TaxID=2975740 RepID=UPI000A708FD1
MRYWLLDDSGLDFTGCHWHYSAHDDRSSPTGSPRSSPASRSAGDDTGRPAKGEGRLSNVHSGRVLDNPGASTSAGTALDQWQDTNAGNQWWKLVPAATSGSYHLVNVKSGLHADVQSGSAADGAKVVQWPAGSGSHQEWQPVGV